jgi:hypothetical protein
MSGKNILKCVTFAWGENAENKTKKEEKDEHGIKTINV